MWKCDLGHPNLDLVTECQACAAEGSQTKRDSEPQPRSPDRLDAGSLFCTRCGQPVELDARFCAACGNPVVAAPSAAAPTPPRAPAGPPPPPGYPAPLPVQPQVRTNGFAIASLVLGILWLWWIGSVLALVFGYVARSQIERSPQTQTGNGLAIAGIVLGWIGVGFLALILVLANLSSA